MRKLFVLFFSYLLYVGVNAQSSISDVFLTMPDNILVGVDADQRAELLSRPDSLTVTVVNQIMEEIVRTKLTDDYISLKTSAIGALDIKLLPLVNNTDIISVITTVCGPACDSRIDFYTTTWQPLNQKDLFPSKDKSWFLVYNYAGENNSDEQKNAFSTLDMNPIKLSFEADTKNIKAEYDIKKYLSSDDYKLLEPFLIKEPILFKWDKLSYKK